MTPRLIRSILPAAVLVIGIAGPAAAGARAHAASSPRTTSTPPVQQEGPGWATYNGQTVDLANGWGSAHACYIFVSGATECFASISALEQATGVVVPTSGATVTSRGTVGGTTAQVKTPTGRVAAPSRLVAHSTCSGGGADWLYQNINFGGNTLGIASTNTWFDLSDYSFANETSSYINSTNCNAYGEHTLGGSEYDMPANDFASSLGSWNDKIAYVYLAS